MNTLQLDPTRTNLLVKRFSNDLTRRSNTLQRAITHLLLEENVLGLTTNTRWRYMSSPEQTQAFQKWLASEMQKTYFDNREEAENQWWEKYIQEARRKGLKRTYDDIRSLPDSQQRMDFYRGTREEFLRSAFTYPPSVERVKLMAGRIYTDLKGITEAMSTSLTRELVDGLIRGNNPRAIAKNITDKVANISRTRAETLARTEIIRNFAEAQLDAFAMHGMDQVGVAVEFSVAKNRVCPQCAALQGVVLSLDQARGIIPVHPNCRCAWLPANIGEDAKGQKRGRSRLAAVVKSIAAGNKNPPVVNADCGTGAGGFKPGNTCAKGGMEAGSDKPKGILSRLKFKLKYGNYCGPGGVKFRRGATSRRGMPKPINKVDAACQQHDLDYAKAEATWKSGLKSKKREQAVREADLRLLKALDKLVPRTEGKEHKAAKLIRAYFKYVNNSDCGTGSGGFKPGNTCAKGGLLGRIASSAINLIWDGDSFIHDFQVDKAAFQFVADPDSHAITSSGGDWSISFKVLKDLLGNPVPPLEAYSMRGDFGVKAVRVMRVIGAATEKFIRQQQPESIVFSAENKNKGRVKLYRHVASILAARNNYSVKEEDFGFLGTYFTLTKQINKLSTNTSETFEEAYDRGLTSMSIVDRILVYNANCGTGAGGFKPGNTCAKGGGNARAKRAKRYHVPATRRMQRASDRIEAKMAKALGLHRTRNNHPVDLISLDGMIGVEVKVIHTGQKDRAEMRRDSRERKEAWINAVPGRRAYTLVIDNRNRYDRGRHAHRYTGSRYHLKAGVGAYRFSTMTSIKKLSSLKSLIL